MYPVLLAVVGSLAAEGSRKMKDLADIRLADVPKRFPNWLVAADRRANELLGRQDWLMRKGLGDRWLDQPTFKDWCRDPRGVVLAETTPKQIAMADDAGCRLELLRGSVRMPRAADDSRPENVSHVRGAESSWMLVHAPSLRDG
jgi:hypothetical protein